MGRGRNGAGSGIQWEPEVEPLRVFGSGFQNPLGTGFKTLCYGSQGLKPCGERVFFLCAENAGDCSIRKTRFGVVGGSPHYR